MSIKMIGSFLAGVAVGSVAALFMAPKSGEELRAELSREVQSERERLMKEYNRAIDEINVRLDKLQSDVQSTLEQTKRQELEAEPATQS